MKKTCPYLRYMYNIKASFREKGCWNSPWVGRTGNCKMCRKNVFVYVDQIQLAGNFEKRLWHGWLSQITSSQAIVSVRYEEALKMGKWILSRALGWVAQARL